jgi:hypothetical protein
MPVVHLTSGSSNKGFGKGGLVQRRSAQMGVLYDKFTPFEDEIGRFTTFCLFVSSR